MMISFVIPVYNERDTLTGLHGEILDALHETEYDFEVLYIDDGSRDGCWDIISELASIYPHVRGIRFRRNFGKAAALTAGFRAATGDVVMTLDADLQDNPADIGRFLEQIASGDDVVSGWKRIRHDPWHKVWPSRLFNFMVSKLTGVHLHDHNCGMKAYRAEVLREIRLYGELHRFIPVLAAARGFQIGEVEVNHRPRRFGVSKYGWTRFVKGFLDLLTVKFMTGFDQRPQHVLGTLGLIAFFGGGLGMTYLAGTWGLRWVGAANFPPLSERPLLLYSVAGLLLGAQLMSVGLVAEMIAAVRSHHESYYAVAEQTEMNSLSRLRPHGAHRQGRLHYQPLADGSDGVVAEAKRDHR